MKLIKSNYNIIPQEANLEGVYKQIELAGRTCYKSEDKITDDSAFAFVERMVKSGHGAMLEHGTVYLSMPEPTSEVANLYKYIQNPYSKVTILPINGAIYITTNYRVLIENNWLDDLIYICEPTEFHEKRVSVRFICDRGVSHEFVRHRVMSFAQESTRYCNYSKDKFDNQITFIIPIWVTEIEEGTYHSAETPTNLFIDNSIWFHTMQDTEESYNSLIEQGWSPQQARAILPNSLKTELVVTGFVSDWKHFFSLRDAKTAHPSAQKLAKPLHEEFKKFNLL